MWDGQTDNYKRFVKWVKQQEPDLCVWCESISLFKTNTADYLDTQDRYLLKNWNKLAKRYGHKYIYIGGHRDDYPQVITSKYPIENVKRIIGNGKDSIVTHGAGWAQVKIKNKKLNIVTLHTWPQAWAFNVPAQERERSKSLREGDNYRLMEMTYICKETILSSKDAKNELWIMLGDFNSRSIVDNWVYNYHIEDSRLFVHNYIRENTPYLDLIHEKHPNDFLTTTGGKSRIDFVYCTPALYKAISNANVISDGYTTPVRNPQKLSNFWHPSDHRPIIIEIDKSKLSNKPN